jgi:hypothetical protein
VNLWTEQMLTLRVAQSHRISLAVPYLSQLKANDRAWSLGSHPGMWRAKWHWSRFLREFIWFSATEYISVSVPPWHSTVSALSDTGPQSLCAAARGHDRVRIVGTKIQGKATIFCWLSPAHLFLILSFLWTHNPVSARARITSTWVEKGYYYFCRLLRSWRSIFIGITSYWIYSHNMSNSKPTTGYLSDCKSEVRIRFPANFWIFALLFCPLLYADIKLHNHELHYRFPLSTSILVLQFLTTSFHTRLCDEFSDTCVNFTFT